MSGEEGEQESEEGTEEQEESAEETEEDWEPTIQYDNGEITLDGEDAWQSPEEQNESSEEVEDDWEPTDEQDVDNDEENENDWEATDEQKDENEEIEDDWEPTEETNIEKWRKEDFNLTNENYINKGIDDKDFKPSNRNECMQDKPYTYDRTKERIKIDPKILRAICDEIIEKYPEKKLSNYKISELIGKPHTISNALAGYAMNIESFKKLEILLGKPIKHEIKEPRQMTINLEENENLAEMIGIILGDGHVNDRDGRITIALNVVDELNYVNYIKRFMEKIFCKSPTEILFKDKKSANGTEKGIELRINSINLVDELKLKGLIPGNKVKNQVGIPKWIRKNNLFKIACLRGLIDTDGWIGIAKKDKTIKIKFSNASKPLVDGFRELCISLGIKSGNVNGPYEIRDPRSGYVSKIWIVKIAAKEQVKKFLEKIRPMKWKFRKNLIGKKLIDLDIGKTVKEAITEVFNYQRSRYTKKYAKYLKKVVEEQGNIKNARDFLKKQNKKLVSTQKSFKNFIMKLFEEDKYKEKYGVIDYKKWLNSIPQIRINETTSKITQFPLSVKKIISRFIYEILENEANPLNEGQILEKLNTKMRKSDCKRISYLLNNPKYNQAIIDRIIPIISFVKMLIDTEKPGIKITRKGLERKFKGLSLTDIKKIIYDINKIFGKSF